MIEKLLSRLHRVFNKEPQSVPVISLATTEAFATIEIKDLTLTLKVAGFTTAVFDLTSMTISQLADAINSQYSVGALTDEDNGNTLIDEDTGNVLVDVVGDRKCVV
jgi:hypothetical protein